MNPERSLVRSPSRCRSRARYTGANATRRYPRAAVKPTLIITHLEDRHNGLVRESLERAGCRVREFNPLDQAPAPVVDELSGIVSLGGRVSATQADRDPFLAGEVALMAAALDRRLPVLGMCLGAQLLAVAAGGRVTTMAQMYVGWPELELRGAAVEDPVFGGLGSGLPVLEWHEDIIELPTAATVLGSTPGPGAALFRIGRAAWGSQMHLELTPPMLLDGWLVKPGDVAEIEAAGHDIDEFRALSAYRLQAQMAAARPVFSRFAGIVLAADHDRAPGDVPSTLRQ
jgi:GMP synthase (glutamine-hydrolysing)